MPRCEGSTRKRELLLRPTIFFAPRAMSPLGIWRSLYDEQPVVVELFELLWKSGARVPIPDTLVYKFGRLDAWFFVSKSGQLKQKKNQTVVSQNVFDKVRAAFPDTSTHLMLLDIAGGSLEEPPVPEFATGQGYDFTKSQALQCAYELVQAGYTNLSYVRGGCNDWFEDAHNDAEGVLPKGEGQGPWLGHSEVYAYRQFRMKDPTKGRRTF